MNGRTRLLVGGLILALGAGTLWLAATQSQDDVRYVEQILASPAAHRDGAYTLMGVPEPSQIPFTGPNGTYLAKNPDFADTTVDSLSWTRGGELFFSTRTLEVKAQPDGSLLWSFRNETRRQPADRDLAFPAHEKQWTLGRADQAFPILGFAPDGIPRPSTPRIWAWYDKAPEHAMQPKPSQFTGHLLTTLPDGSPLPDGAMIYGVSQFTAGCSSKFLPPAAKAKYEADYGSG